MSSKRRWIIATIVDWVVIAVAIAAGIMIGHWIAFFIAILIVGNRQHALSMLAHDGAHRKGALNDALTNWGTFYWMGINLSRYRVFHFAHHKNVNNSLDPEGPLKRMGPCPMDGPFSVSRITGHVLLDLVGFGLPQIGAFLWVIRPRKLGEFLPLVILWVTSALLILAGLWQIPLIWFLSLSTSFWACFRLRVWSEHVGLPEGETLHFRSNWLQRLIFMPHGADKHWAHHNHPQIPYWELNDTPQICPDLCEARKTA